MPSSTELKKYDEALYRKPRWLVLNKIDVVAEDEREHRIQKFVADYGWQGKTFRDFRAHRRGLQGTRLRDHGAYRRNTTGGRRRRSSAANGPRAFGAVAQTALRSDESAT